LAELGQEVRVCAPPDFGNWIDGLGIPFVPIGPELRQTAKPSPSPTRALPSPRSTEQRRQMVEGTVATQFEVVAAAAEGCDVLVGCGALQIAAGSVAEQRGIPYVFAAYSPDTLPSRTTRHRFWDAGTETGGRNRRQSNAVG